METNEKKRKFNFSALYDRIGLLLKRMPVSVAMIVGLATLAWLDINMDDYAAPYQLIAFGVVGLFISVVAALWLEDRMPQQALRRHAATVGAVLLWGVYCLFLPSFSDRLPNAVLTQIVALGGVFFCAIFFISFLKRGQDRPYWKFAVELLFQMGIAGLFGMILWGGLGLALWAIDELFDIYLHHRVYLNVVVACLCLFTPLWFLANIPSQEEKHNPDYTFYKLLKILGLYIILPILAVYMLILYVYLATIIVAWKLPNGWVSWLVSALSLGVLAVINILYPLQLQKHRLTLFLSRYAGLLILPLLILMSIGIIRRISDYGLTINRLYIVLLNIWFYGIFLWLYFSKAAHIKWILISAAAIALLASIGPWNIQSLAKRTVTSDVNRLLEHRKLVQSESPTWVDSLDTATKRRIIEGVNYLVRDYGPAQIQSFFADSIDDKRIYSLLESVHLNHAAVEADFHRWFSFEADSSVVITLDNYARCLTLSWNHYGNSTNGVAVSSVENQLVITALSDSSQLVFPIEDHVVSLLERDKRHSQAPIILNCHNNLLIINKISGTYQPNSSEHISIETLSGCLLFSKQ